MLSRGQGQAGDSAGLALVMGHVDLTALRAGENANRMRLITRDLAGDSLAASVFGGEKGPDDSSELRSTEADIEEPCLSGALNALLPPRGDQKRERYRQLS